MKTTKDPLSEWTQFRIAPITKEVLKRRKSKKDRSTGIIARRLLRAITGPAEAVSIIKARFQSFESRMERGELDQAEEILKEGLEAYHQAIERKAEVERALKEYEKLEEIGSTVKAALDRVQEKKWEAARETYQEISSSKASRKQREFQL